MTAPAGFATADRIIRFAMEDAGLLQDGDDPTSEQSAKYMQRLNDIINLWQTQGLKLFLLQDLPITLTAGKRTYSLGPAGDVVMVKPTRVLQAYYLDVNSVRRPLTPMSWDEYLRLSTVVNTGAVNSYFVDKQVSQLAVSLWLVPDATCATGTVHVLAQTQIVNLVSLTDTMMFPQEWFLALRWGLADELATGQPQSIMDRCQSRALAYRTVLEDWDVEDAPTSFAPDSRSQYYNNSFQ